MKLSWCLVALLPWVQAVPLSITISIDLDDSSSYLTASPLYHGASLAYTHHEVSSEEVENGAPWGLARISHRERLGFSSFTKYVYNSTEEGVTVYVIGSGVNIQHGDFEGRAAWGTTTMSDVDDEDMFGLGTHVAGTIAGGKYGVAKKARIMAIKVVEGENLATSADLEQGITWMVADHKKSLASASSEYRGSVAVLAFEETGLREPAISAINSAVEAGIHFVLPAGVSNRDACDLYPNVGADTLTLSSSGLDDSKTYFSNYGPCVDAFAPGINILSAWTGSTQTTKTASGSVQAAAHGAGLIAYMLGLEEDAATARAISPADMKDRVLKSATSDMLNGLPPQTNNLLLCNGGVSDSHAPEFKSLVHQA